MPLLDLWASNPTAVSQLSIAQIVATAGDGNLRDNSEASKEVREYLSQVPSQRLEQYVEQCLAAAFPKSGLVLQDIVNELGRRLDYSVENGRYQGVTGGVGFDGIWSSPDGGEIIVEVKTTDTYRVSLDTIAAYRRKLQQANKIGTDASVLLVVGRDDTGELEAQVRGSRHAWDMRLISADALLSLVKLKESTEGGDTGRKIRSILAPVEYTRLDGLVDVMFTTAKDVETTVDSEKAISLTAEGHDTADSESAGAQFTDPELLDATRLRILDALAKREGRAFLKRSRALAWDASHAIRAVCTVSKRYTRRGSTPYWYAYHPAWDAFLDEGEKGWLVLGCVDLDLAFALPLSVVRAQLDKLNTTERADGDHYWHVKILEPQPGVYSLQLPRVGGSLPLAEFALSLA
jgi:hypothetical protein